MGFFINVTNQSRWVFLSGFVLGFLRKMLKSKRRPRKSNSKFIFYSSGRVYFKHGTLFAAVEMKVRELQLSSNAIWQMIYLHMVFTNPNNPVCGSIVSLPIMPLSWLNLRWLTQGYQQHSTIDCLKLEQD